MSDVGDWRSWPKEETFQKFSRADPEFSMMVESWMRHPVTRALIQRLEEAQQGTLWALIGNASGGPMERVRTVAGKLDLLGALVDFLKEPLEKAKKE